MSENETKVDLLDYILNLFFVPAFIATLVIFDVLQRVGALIGSNAHFRVLVWLHYALRATLKISGATITIKGEELVPEKGPLIIVSNHQSLFDIPLLHLIFKKHRPRFVAKKELAKWLPSVSFNLRYGNSAVIDRDNPRQAIPELKRVAAKMKEENFSIIIWPEGTRARDGELKEFLGAGLTVLLKELPDATIIPVVIDGSWKVSYRPLGPIPRNTAIKIEVLPSLKAEAQPPKELVAELHRRIAEGLSRLRQP